MSYIKKVFKDLMNNVSFAGNDKSLDFLYSEGEREYLKIPATDKTKNTAHKLFLRLKKLIMKKKRN